LSEPESNLVGAQGLGPLSGVSIGRLSGVGALWDCVPRVCGGGGGCAGGGVPLGAVPALSWCGEVSLGGIHSAPRTEITVTLDRWSVRGGGWFFVWSFEVLFLSCRVLCGVVLVVCLCV